MKKITVFTCLALAISNSALAAPNNSISTNQFTESLDALDREASMKISETEQVLAKQWMLEESDWRKYKTIMSGPRGIWSPGLDPLTALGVSETDPQERRRYAEIWMKMEIRRVELELAFEVERQKAGKRINGDLLAINNTAWIKQWEDEQSAVVNSINFFVDASCTDDCKKRFDDVFKSVGKNSKLDIYFRDGIDSEDIGVWAAFMGVDPALVRTKKVTLNFDAGRSASMGVSPESFPAVRIIDLKTGNVTETFKN